VNAPKPKYPGVVVQLSGQDGNAFMILGRVRKAMHGYGVPREEIEKFVEEAMDGDYDEMLRTCMRWVQVR